MKQIVLLLSLCAPVLAADLTYLAGSARTTTYLSANCTGVAKNQVLEKVPFTPSLFNTIPPKPIPVQLMELTGKFQANTVEIVETNFSEKTTFFGGSQGTMGKILMNFWQCRIPTETKP